VTRVFFDSNILIYAFTADDKRQPQALALLEDGGMISVQCLNEFATVMRGKRRWNWPQIRESLILIVAICDEPIPVDRDTHAAAIDLAERYHIAVYDALIAAAALGAGCDTLYSEDMHDGLMIDGRLRIVNPFAVA
jgi:predicted nucleic acid-binding protein